MKIKRGNKSSVSLGLQPKASTLLSSLLLAQNYKLFLKQQTEWRKNQGFSTKKWFSQRALCRKVAWLQSLWADFYGWPRTLHRLSSVCHLRGRQAPMDKGLGRKSGCDGCVWLWRRRWWRWMKEVVRSIFFTVLFASCWYFRKNRKVILSNM